MDALEPERLIFFSASTMAPNKTSRKSRARRKSKARKQLASCNAGEEGQKTTIFGPEVTKQSWLVGSVAPPSKAPDAPPSKAADAFDADAPLGWCEFVPLSSDRPAESFEPRSSTVQNCGTKEYTCASCASTGPDYRYVHGRRYCSHACFAEHDMS
jgi:hypothetical protein